jgi:hypothetical protein
MTQVILEVLDEDEGFLLGKLDNLGIIVWRLTPTTSRVRRIVTLFPRFHGERGFGLLTVVSPACAPVDAEVRRVFDEAMRTYRDKLLGIATVIETEGVLGGLSRAIARTLSIVSRAPYPHNVYATIDDASKWLPTIAAQRSEPTLAPSQIVEAIGEHYRRPPRR